MIFHKVVFLPDFVTTNIGDEFLILNYNKNKSTLAPPFIGPFVIQQVHVNGTVTIIDTPNVFERVNIHRICPYHYHGG
jgi:hypothetical protein